jgi:polyphenol oxidase
MTPMLREWARAASLGATVAVTTRHGGVSTGPYASLNLGLHVGDDPAAVVTNRTRAAMAFGVTLENLVFAEQVHGAETAVVGSADRGRGTRHLADAVGSVDTLVTADHGVVLVVLVADCLPVVLIDPAAGVLAVVHAGWRGTAAGVLSGALGAMAELGGRVDATWAFFGPCVEPDLYQVDEPVHRGLVSAVSPHALSSAVARPDGVGHWKVDLREANRQQLALAGLAPERIEAWPASTAEDDFFSDRAARPCGRFALMAALNGR